MNRITRFEFICMAGAATAGFAFTPTQLLAKEKNKRDQKMYGLIGKITAKAGRRDELIKYLLEGTADMPGCLSYIISKDSKDEHSIWVTEVWDSKENHKASLSLPTVKEAITKGRPLIAEFSEQIEIEPVGGHGLVSEETQ